MIAYHINVFYTIPRNVALGPFSQSNIATAFKMSRNGKNFRANLWNFDTSDQLSLKKAKSDGSHINQTH